MKFYKSSILLVFVLISSAYAREIRILDCNFSPANYGTFYNKIASDDQTYDYYLRYISTDKTSLNVFNEKPKWNSKQYNYSMHENNLSSKKSVTILNYTIHTLFLFFKEFDIGPNDTIAFDIVNEEFDKEKYEHNLFFDDRYILIKINLLDGSNE